MSCARHIISCARHIISCARLIISCARHNLYILNAWISLPLTTKMEFFSFNLRCECLNYILIRLWAINIVDYLFLSTKCINRGRLIWNSNDEIYKVNTTGETWNLVRLTWFWTSNTRISSHWVKRRDVYHRDSVSGLWFFFIKSEKYMSVIVTCHNL